MLLQTQTRLDEVKKARKRCKRKFIYYFPKGYEDKKYIDWERGYKSGAHTKFREQFNKTAFRKLLEQEAYDVIAAEVVRIESKTNLLFSFEKMALRDAVKSAEGAKAFSVGLYDYLYGK
ncbi:MAG TPA: hypothetical protein VKH37_03965, partial [Ferruginibacter sp.]|nr:hypothetical protein [Ferruginibacter sp.]